MVVAAHAKQGYPLGRRLGFSTPIPSMCMSLLAFLSFATIWKWSNLLRFVSLTEMLPHDNSNNVLTLPMQMNNCLLQVANVRDIKLYSQNDEDGALLQTLKCMGGHGTKEYFEFGSEDGTEVNTRVLRELYGWKGHLLDGGNENPDIPLHKEWFTPSNIVSLLTKYQASKNLDVLSIDCDYDDFFVMREILVAGYKPRILIAEYNVNLGDERSVSVVAKPVGKEAEVLWVFDCYFGASAAALIRLGKVFGYTPVWSNTVNLIFVRTDQAAQLGMVIPPPESFPGPWPRALHRECGGKTWKLIDIDKTAKAADATISHVEFANAFSDIKLGVKDFANRGRTELVWRTFHEIKDN